MAIQEWPDLLHSLSGPGGLAAGLTGAGLLLAMAARDADLAPLAAVKPPCRALRMRRFCALPREWYLTVFPATAVRMLVTWRALRVEGRLTLTERSGGAVLDAALMVAVRGLRPGAPRSGAPHVTRLSLRVRVRTRSGQRRGGFDAC